MPLLWLSLGFVIGVFAGGLFEPYVPAWLVITGASFFFLLLSIHISVRRFGLCYRPLGRFSRIWPADRETLLPGFILPLLPGFFLLGVIRYQITLPEIDASYLAFYNDREERFFIEGVISTDPDLRDSYTFLRIKSKSLRSVEMNTFIPVCGNLLARLPPGGDWRYGDRVELEGRLRTPLDLDDFSYQDYLAHQGIQTTLNCFYCQNYEVSLPRECARLVNRGEGSRLRGKVYDLRRRAHREIEALFPDPEASLLAGILLGIETGIPKNLLEAFRLTGVSHIIAISGFNFAIIAGLLVKVFTRFLGRWRSLPVAWMGMAIYAVLAGATPGVMRAAIMGSLSIFAVRIGRRSTGLNTLAFVAMIMAVFDPHILWDVGFQLSFMATLGLVVYAEPLEKQFKGLAARWLSPEATDRLSGPVSEYFLFTLAAQVTTLPLILHVFKRASLVSLFANPMVLPAQPPLMVLGGLAAVFGMVYRPLGQLVAYIAWPWIAYTNRVVELLAETRLASWTVGGISMSLMVALYVLLFGWTLIGNRLRELVSRKIDLKAPPLGWVLNLGLALLTIVVWQRVFAWPDGRLKLTALDVGGGEALLIQAPHGRSLLVNGGPSANLLSEAVGRRMPAGRREIDFLIVAGARERQVAALPRALDRFQVWKTLWAGVRNGDYSQRELQKRLVEEGIVIVEAQAGQTFELGKGARLKIVAVTRRGAVLYLEWNKFRAMLPVGMDFESQKILMQDPHLGEMTVLLLADEGYAALNSRQWIERWKPQVALLSVEAGNVEGLPHPETLDVLQGVPLLRTDLNGWIEISTDGERMWVEVERP